MYTEKELAKVVLLGSREQRERAAWEYVVVGLLSADVGFVEQCIERLGRVLPEGLSGAEMPGGITIPNGCSDLAWGSFQHGWAVVRFTIAQLRCWFRIVYFIGVALFCYSCYFLGHNLGVPMAVLLIGLSLLNALPDRFYYCLMGFVNGLGFRRVFMGCMEVCLHGGETRLFYYTMECSPDEVKLARCWGSLLNVACNMHGCEKQPAMVVGAFREAWYKIYMQGIDVVCKVK